MAVSVFSISWLLILHDNRSCTKNGDRRRKRGQRAHVIAESFSQENVDFYKLMAVGTVLQGSNQERQEHEVGD